MLFQDDCGGLEVEDVNNPGQFIPATPVKNAIVMNVGDLLQRWSNGMYKAPRPYTCLLTSEIRPTEINQPSGHSPASCRSN
jgi:isopenicillin N synthase-like dioxygenase